MLPAYQVRVRDWTGAVVAAYAGTGKANDNLSYVQCSRLINRIGSHQIIFQGDMSQFATWKLDYQIEVWRDSGRASGQRWAKIYHGFHRSWAYQADQAGQEQYISYGHDLKGLIARASIPTDVTSVYSVKSGPGETVIKAFVRENIGDLASAARQRLGLTVETDLARGTTWSGTGARQPLIDTVKDVALATGIEFDVVSDAPNVFEFKCYYPVTGQDRSIGNAGNLKPAIFSLERNNMAIPVMAESHGEEINVVYVLGQGEEASRDVVEVHNTPGIEASPWNRIEAVRQASNIEYGNLADLAYEGVKVLVEAQSQQSMSFRALQTSFSRYGVDYQDGDIVTGLYHVALNKRIIGTTFAVGGSSPQETIDLEMADVT